jgi:hypothetical protein
MVWLWLARMKLHSEWLFLLVSALGLRSSVSWVGSSTIVTEMGLLEPETVPDWRWTWLLALQETLLER